MSSSVRWVGIAVSLLVVSPAWMWGAPTGSQHFELVKLGDGVYAAVHSPGGTAIGNAGVVDLGGATLIFDTFHSIGAARDLRAVASEVTSSPIRYVVNSHRHNDHVWGNQVFAGEALLIGTEATRRAVLDNALGDVEVALEGARRGLAELEEALAAETDPFKRQELTLSAAWTRAQVDSLAEIEMTPPELTFERELTLHGSRRRARLLTFGPGSTTSDTFLYLPEDGIVFSGDLVMHGMHPILWEGETESWLSTLRRMQGLPIETLVPGHGPVGDASFIATMIRYIELVDEAAEAVRTGGSAEEVTSKPLPEPFGSWFYPGLFATNVDRFPDPRTQR